MSPKYFSYLFILGVSFYSGATPVKKEKPQQQYWSPSRIPSSQSSSSALSESETLSLQRVLKSEDQRIEKDPYLLQAVFHSSPRIAKSAILALGRIGDPYATETLSRILNGKNTELKKLAAFSLGMIGDDLSLRLLSQNIVMEKNPELRGEYYRALGYSRQLSALSILARALRTESVSSSLRNITEGLGILFSGDSASWIVPEETLEKLALLSESSDTLGVSAAFSLSQYKGEPKKLPINLILKALSKTTSDYSKTLLLRTLSKVDSPQVTTTLVAILSPNNSSPMRIESAKSLRGKKISELMLSGFQKSLNSADSHLIIATLETIQTNPENFKGLTETLIQIFKNSKSSWIKGVTLKTLAKLSPDLARKEIKLVLNNINSPLLSPALASLVFLNQTEDWAALIPYLKMGNPVAISESIESMAGIESDRFSNDIKECLKSIILKKDPGLVALIADLAKQNRWTDFAKPLGDSYNSFSADDATETRSSIISALGSIGSDEELPVLEIALKDNSKQVVTSAIEAIKTISGKDIPNKKPVNNKVPNFLSSYNQVSSSVTKRVRIGTTKGNIDIRFFEDAPLTAFHFLDLIQKSFYDGKTFHRIVPNFVVQGGDPRGDGFGGPGFLIRDEVSPRNHERGILGIATSGKDTGGCQFFFNLAPNYHLNGRYTAFAEVTSGLDVLYRLEVGDKITFAKIQ